MEISASPPSAASASTQAQAQVQRKASDQQEAVVSTILDGTKDSAAKAEATGKNLVAVA